MKVNFEFNFEELDNNELRINGRRTDSFSVKQWKSIIIKKEWISWIITTLRNLTYKDYNTWEKTVGINYEDCELAIIMCLFEREHSYIDIFPIWKDEERITPPIEIPYLSWNKSLLMSEFIEPFLVERKRKRKGRGKEKKTTNPTTEEFQYGLQAKLTPEIISGGEIRIGLSVAK